MVTPLCAHPLPYKKIMTGPQRLNCEKSHQNDTGDKWISARFWPICPTFFTRCTKPIYENLNSMCPVGRIWYHFSVTLHNTIIHEKLCSPPTSLRKQGMIDIQQVIIIIIAFSTLWSGVGGLNSNTIQKQWEITHISFQTTTPESLSSGLH